jgi:hypothetical protein
MHDTKHVRIWLHALQSALEVMELNKKYLQIQGKESMTKGDR